MAAGLRKEKLNSKQLWTWRWIGSASLYESKTRYTNSAPTTKPGYRSNEEWRYIGKYGIMSRVFASFPGDRGSVSGRVIPKTQNWYLMPPCLTLSIIWSRIKWSNPGKGVTPSPTPWCSSYWKGSLRVTLDYGHQLYFRRLESFHENWREEDEQVVTSSPYKERKRQTCDNQNK